jgi:hypothetical protein
VIEHRYLEIMHLGFSIQLLKHTCTITAKDNCIILKDRVNDPGLAFARKVGLGPFWT